MERWLVVMNCQTYGMANCLQAQIQNVEVLGMDITTLNSKHELPYCDKLFSIPGVRKDLLEQMHIAASYIPLAVLQCRSFHPDLIYINHEEESIFGPTSHYHSAIAFAAFSKGLSIADTKKLFNGSFYQKCGYIGWWPIECSNIVKEFANSNIDIEDSIIHWGRYEAFMHSVNHPKIHVLYNIATKLIRKLGYAPCPGIMPHDNLANGACFAIYPEIAETLGVPGSYIFKIDNSYRPIDLDAFLHGCFATYDSYLPGSLKVHKEYERGFHRVLENI